MAHGVTLQYSTQTLPRGCLLSKCHMVLQYTCKCNYIYVHKKQTPFTALISIKLTNPGQCYVQMSHIKYRSIWKINVETANRNPLTLLNKYDAHFTNFHETQNHPNCCGRLLYRMLFKSDEKCTWEDKTSFTPLSEVWLSLSWFSRNWRLLDSFCKKNYTEIHENSTNGLVTWQLRTYDLTGLGKCFNQQMSRK
jgi:hypothetical protein